MKRGKTCKRVKGQSSVAGRPFNFLLRGRSFLLSGSNVWESCSFNLIHFFPFALINSHNKMNRRSVLRQLPNTLCKCWAIKVSLTAATLLRVTDKVRISGSASHILSQFKDKPNLNDYRQHFWHNKTDGRGLQANVQTTGSLIREDISSAKRSSLDFVLSVLVYLAV